MTLDPTGIICPFCRSARLEAGWRHLRDGRIHAFGKCPRCGKGCGGIALSRYSYDVEAAIATTAAKVREGRA